MIIAIYLIAGVIFTAYAMNSITQNPDNWWGLPTILKKEPVPVLSACLYFTIVILTWPAYLIIHLISLLR